MLFRSRARYCAGDAGVGATFERIRESILTRSRDPRVLAGEIVAMREKLHAAHPNRSELFDLKHDRGGMIDIEFAVQCLVLGFSSRHPSLTANLGNIALLRMSAEHGLVPAGLAERCRNAYRDFRRMQHALRLGGAPYARVPRDAVGREIEAVKALWRAVLSPAAGT